MNSKIPDLSKIARNIKVPIHYSLVSEKGKFRIRYDVDAMRAEFYNEIEKLLSTVKQYNIEEDK